MRYDERAVSDLLAFILIFTVMLASVGLIATFGWEAVGDARDQAQLDSAERAIINVNDQLNGIADHEAPARATELRLGGGTLHVADGPNVTVDVWENETHNTTLIRDLGSLEYRMDDRYVEAAGGAVLRGRPDASVMRSDPPFVCDGDSARLNVIRVVPETISNIDSTATVQVQSRHARTQLWTPSSWSLRETARNVTVAVNDSRNQAAWERYFEDAGWSDGESPGEFRCDPPGDSMRVIVRYTRVEFRFIR
ncbi:MAG: hypothetical protein ACLFMX_01400 [Halobacteriales archaeon]